MSEIDDIVRHVLNEVRAKRPLRGSSRAKIMNDNFGYSSLRNQQAHPHIPSYIRKNSQRQLYTDQLRASHQSWRNRELGDKIQKIDEELAKTSNDLDLQVRRAEIEETMHFDHKKDNSVEFLLRMEIKNLKDKNRVQENRILILKDQFGKEKLQNDDVRSRLFIISNEHNLLNTANATIREDTGSQIRALELKISDLEDKNKMLHKHLKEERTAYDQQNEIIRNDMAHTVRKYNQEHMDEVERLKHELKRVFDEKNRAEIEAANLRSRLSENKIEVEERLRRMQIINQEEEFRKYQSNLKELHVEITGLKQELGNYKTRNGHFQKELTVKDYQIREVHEKMEHEIKALCQNKLELENLISQKDTQIDQLKYKLIESETYLNESKKETILVNKRFDDEMNGVDLERKVLENKLEERIRIFEEQSRRESARRRELESMIREKDLKINKILTEQDFVKKQNRAFRGDFDALHNKLRTSSSMKFQNDISPLGSFVNPDFIDPDYSYS